MATLLFYLFVAACVVALVAAVVAFIRGRLALRFAVVALGLFALSWLWATVATM